MSYGIRLLFFMAIAGPLASLFLSGVFYGIYAITQAGAWATSVKGVISYLSSINLLLAIFNLVPAFPLDGGRILRSLLWSWKKNLRWSTRIASWLGSAFGFTLIMLGLFSLFSGAFIGGIWWALIGMFVLNASKMSYQRLLIRQALEGEPVSRFMKTDPVTVPPSITIQDLVEDYVYKYHYKMFPVSENHKPVSCISTREIKEIPRDQWEQRTVENVATNCSSENTIEEDTDAMDALSRIHNTKNSRLMVVDKQGELVGILALKDLLQFLSLKLDLEGETLDALST